MYTCIMTKMMRLPDDLHAKISASAEPGESLAAALARLLADHNPYAGHAEALTEMGIDATALNRMYEEDCAVQDRLTGGSE